MSDAPLSPKQFNNENYVRQQGNEDELMDRVRGYQEMTSNVYKNSFSSDLTKVHSQPSGTAFGEGNEAAGLEGEEA